MYHKKVLQTKKINDSFCNIGPRLASKFVKKQKHFKATLAIIILKLQANQFL